jgi:hypothetical protein
MLRDMTSKLYAGAGFMQVMELMERRNQRLAKKYSNYDFHCNFR